MGQSNKPNFTHATIFYCIHQLLYTILQCLPSHICIVFITDILIKSTSVNISCNQYRNTLQLTSCELFMLTIGGKVTSVNLHQPDSRNRLITPQGAELQVLPWQRRLPEIDRRPRSVRFVVIMHK